MRLPAGLQDKPFSAWNQILRDVVLVWDLAEHFGCQRAFEEFIASDDQGHAVEFVAFVANGYKPTSVEGSAGSAEASTPA